MVQSHIEMDGIYKIKPSETFFYAISDAGDNH